MRKVWQTSVVIALLGAVTTGGLATTASATPRPSHATITGGSSKIKLSKSTLNAIKANGYTLSAISPATFDGKTLTTPIRNGTFTVVPEQASINADGGFTISHGGTSVSIAKVKSTTNGQSGSGTAVVTGVGRIKAIITGQPKTLSPTSSTVKASGFSVTMAKPLVKVLDTTFNTTLFRKHKKIGKGSANFTYQ